MPACVAVYATSFGRKIKQMKDLPSELEVAATLRHSILFG